MDDEIYKLVGWLTAAFGGGVLAAKKFFANGKKNGNGHASKEDIRRLEKKLDDFIATQRERNLEFSKQAVTIAEVRAVADGAKEAANEAHKRTDDLLHAAAKPKK